MWFDVENQWSYNLSVSWNVSSPGITNVTSLAPNGSVMVFVENAFDAGVQEPLYRARSGNFTDVESSFFSITPVDVLSYQVAYQSRNSTITDFVVRNNDNVTNVSWSVFTGATTINASNVTVLNKTSSVFVIVETNYTTSGVYTTTGTANSSTQKDNATGVAVV